MVNFRIECHRRRVMWQQRTNIGDAANWEDEKIPCASDSLLFPEKSYDLIKLSNFTMKEIILPKTGGFILDTQTSLKFRENDPKCLHSNEIKAYKSVIESPWLSSSNWQTTHISEIESTPHDERIPCDGDEIIFPINNSYVVDFQSIPMLVFESIAIDGHIMKPNEFKEFLYSSIVGQSSFKNFDNTQFLNNECHEQACVCHQKVIPVKPLGHCCPICGAVFQMKLNSANFNLDGFKSEIEKAINAATSETDRKKVIYHCSVTLGKEKEKNQHYLQLIIVDRFEYKELSSNLMEQLRESMLNKISQSQSNFISFRALHLRPMRVVTFSHSFSARFSL
ncbi:hypothetical protein PVAND_009232 [Polypedilum vanderplanki]|uniref:Protein amnionless n=1 Tax=Polypedilum vanderplanki TaxID=319348 RepID=A0A9J6CDG4_POLVA|nr:hypothetical protein PVAND_009232 [Polypedilum vanderplanki]